MRFSLVAATAAAFALLFAPASFGQWLNYKTPGIPRTPDGKADLKAPAPKLADGTPDLSGIWAGQSASYTLNVANDLKAGDVMPWAEAIYREHKGNLSKDHPALRCLPEMGPLFNMGMYKVLQTPGVIGMMSEGGHYRQILMDGRPLPKDLQPTWEGYSIGHWEGDALVVESAGFNDKTWLDFEGHPHSEALRTTERFHRKDFGHMEARITLDDPKAYKHPWTIAVDLELQPDTELLEYVCNENEKDVQHIVVTETDRQRALGGNAKVSVETLAKYTGVYEMVNQDGKPVDRQGKVIAEGAKPATFTVSLAGEQLMVEVFGAGKIPLATESETKFSVAGTPVEFLKNDQGVVTQLVVRAVEGDFHARRTGGLP